MEKAAKDELSKNADEEFQSVMKKVDPKWMDYKFELPKQKMAASKEKDDKDKL